MTETSAPKPLLYTEEREIAIVERNLMPESSALIRTIAIVVAALSIGLAMFHLFTAVFGTPESRSFRSTHLTVMLVLAILLRPLWRASWDAFPKGAGWIGFAIDMALIALGIGIQVYTLWDVTEFASREGDLLVSDIWLGYAMIVLVLECTRRAVGLPMVLIAVFFIVHSLYAPYFGGFLYGPPTSVTKYVDVVFMRSEGIFGIPISVAATYIVLFILFGAVLIRTGAGRMFIELAIALTGHRRGGPAKASVVASAFLGTVSGSAVANVVTTGSFTIPLMKRLGYKPRFAGAVEACASSGGQITPPIMGAAAFIIAEFLHTSYLSVVVAAAIPTFLYFATIYFMVDIEADKDDIASIPREQLPRARDILRRGWHQLLTLGVLVGLLAVGYSPMMSAFWSIVTLVALSFVRPETRISPVDLMAALEAGVRAAMPVTVACACAGIIIGSIFVSGLGLKFTNQVITLADGNLFALLALTGVAAIILGMGMTTTAVYITVAALIVPALVQLDVVPIAAHLFAFYFGVVSTITPPVALASFAAAAIAGSPPMRTAVESARIGIAKYLVPFVFVYSPSLLFEGPLWRTVATTVLAVFGLWGLSVALEGWLRRAIGMPSRLLVAALSVATLAPLTGSLLFGLPSYVWALGGATLLAAFVFLSLRGASPRSAPTGAGA